MEGIFETLSPCCPGVLLCAGSGLVPGGGAGAGQWAVRSRGQ